MKQILSDLRKSKSEFIDEKKIVKTVKINVKRELMIKVSYIELSEVSRLIKSNKLAINLEKSIHVGYLQCSIYWNLCDTIKVIVTRKTINLFHTYR